MKSAITITILSFLALLAFTIAANAQIPPISMVGNMPDTVTTMEVEIPFNVRSAVGWDTGGGVGVYYRIPETTSWLYAGSGTVSPITWTAPIDNTTYEFGTQVDDNEGNQEPYPHDGPEPQAERTIFLCTSCEVSPPSECPPMTALEMASELATMGFSLAEGYDVLYHWTHPTTGTPVEFYVGQWEVDGSVMSIPDIVHDNPEYGHVTLPYTTGSSQRLRVAGVDDQDRQGPWSEWSVMLVDDGPPGQPGPVQRTRDE